MNKGYLYIFTALGILVFLIIFVFSSLEDKKLHVVICDVGQGDAILLRMPSQAQILIDGGPDKKVLECLSRYMPFWDRSLDAVILTHPHADHLTGLIDVVDRYHLNGFYIETVKTDSDSQKLLEAKLAGKNLSAKDLNKGDILNDKSGVKIKILFPKQNEASEIVHNTSIKNLNDTSVVALLTYGNFSMLLTGDAENLVLSRVTDEAGDIDVLKVPHHGSKNGMSSELLDKIKPEVAVISAGEGNRYGHPARESLDLLSKAKTKIYRTDINGEIEIITDGLNYQLKSSK
jgi:competence protein ComEC